jgi:hypothetical protein
LIACALGMCHSMHILTLHGSRLLKFCNAPYLTCHCYQHSQHCFCFSVRVIGASLLVLYISAPLAWYSARMQSWIVALGHVSSRIGTSVACLCCLFILSLATPYSFILCCFYTLRYWLLPVSLVLWRCCHHPPSIALLRSLSWGLLAVHLFLLSLLVLF